MFSRGHYAALFPRKRSMFACSEYFAVPSHFFAAAGNLSLRPLPLCAEQSPFLRHSARFCGQIRIRLRLRHAVFSRGHYAALFPRKRSMFACSGYFVVPSYFFAAAVNLSLRPQRLCAEQFPFLRHSVLLRADQVRPPGISRLTPNSMLCQFLCSLCSLWLNISRFPRFSIIFPGQFQPSAFSI
jgi:hypothetical protein